MTCKRIARILSERQDRDLPLSKRLVLHIHLSWCIFCRRLAKHLDILRGVSRIAGGVSMIEDPKAFDAALSPGAKTRMRKMLSENHR